MKGRYYRDSQHRYIERHPERVMCRAARQRAREKGIAFSITPDDINIPDVCPALGIPLKRGDPDAAPSLDRIRPELGYVRGNIAVVSNRANRLKSNGTADELFRIAAWLAELTTQPEGTNPHD